MNTQFKKTPASLLTGEQGWTKLVSVPAPEELTSARARRNNQPRPARPSPRRRLQISSVTLVVLLTKAELCSPGPYLLGRHRQPISIQWHLRGLARSGPGLGSRQPESSRSECKLLFWHAHATEGFAKHFRNKQTFETKSCRNYFLWPGSS